jgi:hypothetical protein
MITSITMATYTRAARPITTNMNTCT